MEKRGISPLIATVLLIGFVVTIAAIFWAWYQSTVEGQAEETAEKTTSQYTCATNVDIKISDPTCTNETISFNIENIGLAELKDFRIIVNGTSQETLKFSQFLAPSGKIKTYVQYNSSLVQNLTHATVLPMISSTTCDEKRVTFTLDCQVISPGPIGPTCPDPRLNDYYCENADYTFYIGDLNGRNGLDLVVYGNGTGNRLPCVYPDPRRTDSVIITNIPEGRHYIKANVSRGYNDWPQGNESFYLDINGVAGSPSWDDDSHDNLTRIEGLGAFNFTAGDNNISMHSLSYCPPDLVANSVEIIRMCIYYDYAC